MLDALEQVPDRLHPVLAGLRMRFLRGLGTQRPYDGYRGLAVFVLGVGKVGYGQVITPVPGKYPI
jgi:hypothetical protein